MHLQKFLVLQTLFIKLKVVSLESLERIFHKEASYISPVFTWHWQIPPESYMTDNERKIVYTLCMRKGQRRRAFEFTDNKYVAKWTAKGVRRTLLFLYSKQTLSQRRKGNIAQDVQYSSLQYQTVWFWIGIDFGTGREGGYVESVGNTEALEEGEIQMDIGNKFSRFLTRKLWPFKRKRNFGSLIIISLTFTACSLTFIAC